MNSFYAEDVHFYNNVAWGNTWNPSWDLIELGTSSWATAHNVLQVTLDGTENIVADPEFVSLPSPGIDGVWGTSDDIEGDLRLRASSPAIDHGGGAQLAAEVSDADGNGNSSEPIPTDIDMEDRIQYAAPDAGAYEFQNAGPTDMQLDAPFVHENIPAHAFSMVSTIDSNGGSHTYALVPGPGDMDNALFGIQGFQLWTRQAFDYETRDQYFVRLRSTDAWAASVEKTFVIYVLNIEVPSVPTLWTTPLSDSHVRLDWESISNATGYNIQRSTDAPGDWFALLAVGAGIVSHIDFTVDSAHQYYYRIQASNSEGASAWTSGLPVFNLPETPSSPLASPIGTNEAIVAWQDVDFESAFLVERRNNPGGEWRQVAELPRGATTYADPNVATGFKYFYRIQPTLSKMMTATVFQTRGKWTTSMAWRRRTDHWIRITMAHRIERNFWRARTRRTAHLS